MWFSIDGKRRVRVLCSGIARNDIRRIRWPENCRSCRPDSPDCPTTCDTECCGGTKKNTRDTFPNVPANLFETLKKFETTPKFNRSADWYDRSVALVTDRIRRSTRRSDDRTSWHIEYISFLPRRFFVRRSVRISRARRPFPSRLPKRFVSEPRETSIVFGTVCYSYRNGFRRYRFVVFRGGRHLSSDRLRRNRSGEERSLSSATHAFGRLHSAVRRQ